MLLAHRDSGLILRARILLAAAAGPGEGGVHPKMEELGAGLTPEDAIDAVSHLLGWIGLD